MPEGVFQWENSTAPKGFRKEIVSIGAAKYVSLAALAMIAPVEDVALCHHLHTTERLNRVSSSWLCATLGVNGAKLLLSTIEFEHGRWLRTMGTGGGSVAIEIPVDEHRLRGPGEVYSYIVGSLPECRFLPILDSRSWRSMTVGWQSLLHVRTHTGIWLQEAAIMMKPTSNQETLLRRSL